MAVDQNCRSQNETAPSKLRRAHCRLVVHGINKRDAEHASTNGPPRHVLGAAANGADRFDRWTSERRQAIIAELLDACYAFHQSLQEKGVTPGAGLQLFFQVRVVVREPLAAAR